MGWKYLGAFDINHRPKIGRYVLEKGLIIKLRALGKNRTHTRQGGQYGAGVGYGSGLSGEPVGSRRGPTLGADWEELAADSSQL